MADIHIHLHIRISGDTATVEVEQVKPVPRQRLGVELGALEQYKVLLCLGQTDSSAWYAKCVERCVISSNNAGRVQFFRNMSALRAAYWIEVDGDSATPIYEGSSLGE